MKDDKILIYQVLPRLLGNTNSRNIKNGSIDQNGSGKFNDITTLFLEKIKKDGYTHIWLIGVLAHASTTDYSSYGIPKGFPEIIKGKAGSPYAVRDYYDVNPDLAVDVENRIGEFDSLINRIHSMGMKVIIDFIPNHLARNYKSINRPNGVVDFGENDNIDVSFSPQNNFYYLPNQSLKLNFIDKDNSSSDSYYKEMPAKATGNDSFTSQPSIYDWYETVKLNYGIDYLSGGTKHFNPIPDTWFKMKDILMYWSEKKVDGFRCDMAEMIPLEFWKWIVPQIKNSNPEIIFIAEIYNPSLYRPFLEDNTFDYLYDKVGVYDTIREVATGCRPSSDISFALNNVGDIQTKMVNFIENHDEQRVASDFFLGNGERAKASMILSSCINTNPVMVYFGQELGEPGMDEEGFSGKDGRTTIFDYWSINTIRRWNNDGKWNNEQLTNQEKELKGFYSKLISLCNTEESLSKGLFYDLMPANYDNNHFDSTKQFAFLRGYQKELLLVVVNFDNRAVEVLVNIPNHAIDFFKFEQHDNLVLKPLISDSAKIINISNINSLRIRVDQNSGEIYKVLAL